MDALVPRERPSRRHPDPHPHFGMNDRYVICTYNNADGHMDVSVTPVAQLIEKTTETTSAKLLAGLAPVAKPVRPTALSELADRLESLVFHDPVYPAVLKDFLQGAVDRLSRPEPLSPSDAYAIEVGMRLGYLDAGTCAPKLRTARQAAVSQM